MYAIEFETDITSRYLELRDYDRLANKHARVIILVDEDAEQADPEANVRAFKALQAARKDRPEVARELQIESMEDDVNNDIF